jgi:hypothetical protein
MGKAMKTLKYKWVLLLEQQHISLHTFILSAGLKGANVYNWAKGSHSPNLDHAIILRNAYGDLTGEYLTLDEFWAKTEC